jgi:hypothetical protein
MTRIQGQAGPQGGGSSTALASTRGALRIWKTSTADWRTLRFLVRKGLIMTLCPIAIVAGCKKCPAFSVCPLKTVIGDAPKAADPKASEVKKK